MSKVQTDGLKVIMALWIFFCHVFPDVNFFGFIPVSVFFFIAGYGLFGRSAECINRLSRLFLVYCLFVCMYSVFAGNFFWKIPVAWFLLVYALQMIFYRVTKSVIGVFLLDVILLVIMAKLDFNFPWYSSMVAFPLGLQLRKNPNLFHRYPFYWLAVLVFSILASFAFGMPFYNWGVVFCWLSFVHRFCFVFEGFSGFSRYSMPFYLGHYMILAILGVCGDFGRELAFDSRVFTVFLGFFLSCFLAFVVNKFLQIAKI